jgi:hypothetical protein
VQAEVQEPTPTPAARPNGEGRRAHNPEYLAAATIHFEYFGLRNPATDPEAKKAVVTQIPTAVVFVGSGEAARILSDADWQAPEIALRAILERHRGGP